MGKTFLLLCTTPLNILNAKLEWLKISMEINITSFWLQGIILSRRNSIFQDFPSLRVSFLLAIHSVNFFLQKTKNKNCKDCRIRNVELREAAKIISMRKEGSPFPSRTHLPPTRPFKFRFRKKKSIWGERGPQTCVLGPHAKCQNQYLNLLSPSDWTTQNEFSTFPLYISVNLSLTFDPFQIQCLN